MGQRRDPASARAGGSPGDKGGVPGGASPRRKVLVLHGNRQTGDLLLGRMARLTRKATRRLDVKFVAPDAPFLWTEGGSDADAQDADADVDTNAPLVRTWWRRRGDEYAGLERSLAALRAAWDDDGGGFVGILGFSQGARLAHLIALLHEAGAATFRGLRFVVLAAGYGDVPLPANLAAGADLGALVRTKIRIASLHVMGLADRLIPVASSRALLVSYENPSTFEHAGGHHVPMQAAAVETYLAFIEAALSNSSDTPNTEEMCERIPNGAAATATAVDDPPTPEQAQAQQDECESLALIFPDEFTLHSPSVPDDASEYGRQLAHPISYSIRLRPPPDQITDESLWPSDINLALRITYPPSYPDVPPVLALDHTMNLLEFKIGQEQACCEAVRDAAAAETGMPCAMSCVYAAREFFEGWGLAAAGVQPIANESDVRENEDCEEGTATDTAPLGTDLSRGLLPRVSRERVAECHQQGLDIANLMLVNHCHGEGLSGVEDFDATRSAEGGRGGKGGTWRYTIGLVGKPSAGKSTFFNAASAFARQRGADAGTDDDSQADLGGATMAPHPFTTIDPNVGYCLVPAPPGSCPEDDAGAEKDCFAIGSTHGRDSKGRRLLPVTLKDVAGLVPGAYAGRGKGNKFLDDLTDADVLLHVVDASGSSDAEGNKVGFERKGSTEISGAGAHPIDDLAWIRHELLEWVYANLATKWDSVARRGRAKLVDMFSGYRQGRDFVLDVLLATEKWLESHEGRPRAFDCLADWDEGDLRRLVSAFLGARFPMALALNKSDLPSATQYVQDIESALPIHGAHCAIPLCAKSEMAFMRKSITSAISPGCDEHASSASAPEGVWSCLQKAMGLRQPVLVFPVNDMATYEPLPGLNEYSIGHSSLPNAGMIACLQAAGGSPPSQWNASHQKYAAACNGKKQMLRDVLVMKPGSTVEDAFSALKALGALGGEFVRAEGAGCIGEKAKLVKKDDFLCGNNRILRVMSNKKTQWQKKG